MVMKEGNTLKSTGLNGCYGLERRQDLFYIMCMDACNGLGKNGNRLNSCGALYCALFTKWF